MDHTQPGEPGSFSREAGQAVATPEEVLATFTELMRSEKSAERLKAAEQLAKYHSLFAPKEEEAADLSEAASAVAAAVADILAQKHD